MNDVVFIGRYSAVFTRKANKKTATHLKLLLVPFNSIIDRLRDLELKPLFTPSNMINYSSHSKIKSQTTQCIKTSMFQSSSSIG